jgi:glycosyltransferase involved in cell wall biosynthesis
MLINDVRLGGAQVIAAGIVEELQKSNWDISYWYVAEQTNAADRSIFDRYANIKSRARHIPAPSIITLRRMLKAEHVDVLHCHLPYAIIVGTVAAIGTRTKILAHYHNTSQFNSWKVNILLRLLRPFFSVQLCYSKVVEQELFGSVHLLSEPTQVVNQRSYTIPNFVDDDRLNNEIQNVSASDIRSMYGITDTAPVILVTGRMLSWKGHEVAVRAFAEIYQQYPEARLLLVGDGPERARVEECVRNLGLTQCVIFAGEQPSPVPFLAASTIFASPLIYADTFVTKEGIGVVVLEAMAAGLPVIVSDYPTTRDFVRNEATGMIVEPGSPAALAKAIRQLIAHPELRNSLGSAARAYIHHHASQKHVVGIYRSLYLAVHHS